MEQTEQVSEEQTQAPPPPPQELVRPVSGRLIAGVAEGLSNRLGIADWIVRAAFVVTAFVGGLGVALYLAGWALIRSEDEPDTPAERFFSGQRSTAGWVGVGLMLIAALILLGTFTFFSGEVIFAIALLSVGLLLYTGTIAPAGRAAPEDGDLLVAEGDLEPKEGVQRMSSTQIMDPEVTTEIPADDSPVGGYTPPPPTPTPTPTPPDLPPAAPRERSILGRLTIGVMLLGLGVLALLDSIDTVPIDADPRHYMALAVTILGLGLLVGSVVGRARWLIVLGAFMVPTLIFSPAFEYDWNSETFDRFVQPTTFEELETSYTIDVGNMVIDLTRLPWDGESVDLDASAGIGNIEVIVPSDVALDGEAQVDVGHVQSPDGEAFGIGDPTVTLDRSGDNGLIRLDVEVNIGNIEVRER